MNLEQRFFALVNKGMTAHEQYRMYLMMQEEELAADELAVCKAAQAQATIIVINCPKIAAMIGWKHTESGASE